MQMKWSLSKTEKKQSNRKNKECGKRDILTCLIWILCFQTSFKTVIFIWIMLALNLLRRLFLFHFNWDKAIVHWCWKLLQSGWARLKIISIGSKKWVGKCPFSIKYKKKWLGNCPPCPPNSDFPECWFILSFGNFLF